MKCTFKVFKKFQTIQIFGVSGTVMTYIEVSQSESRLIGFSDGVPVDGVVPMFKFYSLQGSLFLVPCLAVILEPFDDFYFEAVEVLPFD